MRIKTLTLAAATAIGLCSAANAATFNASQTQILTSSGQDFSFTFSGLAPSDGTGGTVTISSGINQANPGTFDGLDLDQSSEFFSLSIDGTSFGNFNCGGGTGNTVITGNTGGIDCDFSLPLALDGATLDGFLADGSVTVDIDFSANVTAFSAELDEVIVSLTYEEGVAPVPLPATGLLLVGALGIMAARRRRA